MSEPTIEELEAAVVETGHAFSAAKRRLHDARLALQPFKEGEVVEVRWGGDLWEPGRITKIETEGWPGRITKIETEGWRTVYYATRQKKDGGWFSNDQCVGGPGRIRKVTRDLGGSTS